MTVLRLGLRLLIGLALDPLNLALTSCNLSLKRIDASAGLLKLRLGNVV
jgi:hypothetical protein